MIPSSIVHACSVLLPHLIAPALRSLLLACFAALALGAFRVKNIAPRLAVWTAVLYVALAMPMLGIVLPSVSLAVPAAAARFVTQNFGPLTASRINEEVVGIQSAVPAQAPTTAAISVDDYLVKLAPRVRLRHQRVIVSPSIAASVTNLAVSPDTGLFSGSVTLPPSNVSKTRQPLPWVAILSFIYFAVAGFFLARLLLGIVFSRRLVGSARPIYDEEATRPLSLRAWEAGLSDLPRLAESAAISVPVTLGILRPVILFPIEWREWDAAALHAVIAHELSHVIRRDALTQCLSLVHRAIFWFSPLSWWLHRCLADVAEEASDEAALVSGADRARYAETLLGFFAALQETPHRVYWHGVSMAKAGQAEKRLDRILAWKGDVGMRLNKFLAVGMLLAGIPVVLLAAAARPSVADTNGRDTSITKVSLAISDGGQGQVVDPTPVVAPARPATPMAPAPNVAPSPAVPIAAPTLPMPGPEPMPTPRVVPPVIAVEPNVVVMPRVQVQLRKMMSDEEVQKLRDQVNDAVSRLGKSKEFAEVEKNMQLQLKMFQQDAKVQTKFANDSPKIMMRGPDGRFSDRYVIVSGDSPIFMSGDSQDVEHATALRGKVTGDFIWFQRDEKSYLIRDQATVNRAKELFKPEQALGAKQQALGKQQQALGDQQRDLGRKMQTIQVPLPDMTADMQKIEAEMKQLSAGGTQQQLGDLQRQLGDLQRKVGQVQSQAGDQERQMNDPMRALGQQQRQLGEQQRALGEQQRDASRAARDQMKQLLDDAVSHGTAQPE
jgi:beta-lactamase regulating signal transducer with metallopeptidase domain